MLFVRNRLRHFKQACQLKPAFLAISLRLMPSEA
jgi:hypothetical protein